MIDLLTKFTKLKTEQIKLAEEYEAKESYELAYIAYWSVTEHTCKDIGDLYLRKNLKKQLTEWQKYLDDEISKRPKGKQISLRLENTSIPPINHIEDILGKLPKTEKLLKPQTKHRNKRNDIAHRAHKFGYKKTYLEYKEVAIAAIGELERAIIKL